MSLQSLNEYTNYWNEWHFEWSRSIQLHALPNAINGWDLPMDNGGHQNPIYQYFPEPYWGNIDRESFKGIFLNINPGRADEPQNINSNNSLLINTYRLNNHNYQETVIELCNQPNYLTTRWMNRYRVRWLNELLDDPAVSLQQVLLPDLIPWHTVSQGDITNYANRTNITELIINETIRPLSRISSLIEGKLKNKIIVRGSLLIDLINSNSLLQEQITSWSQFVILNTNNTIPKFNSLLTVIKINDANFFIFSGGASMALPRLSHTILPINQASVLNIDLKNFILNY